MVSFRDIADLVHHREVDRDRTIEADTEARALHLIKSVMCDPFDLVMIALEIVDMSGLAVLRSLHQLKSRGINSSHACVHPLRDAMISRLLISIVSYSRVLIWV
jgi:hypothetical protein